MQTLIPSESTYTTHSLEFARSFDMKSTSRLSEKFNLNSIDALMIYL